MSNEIGLPPLNGLRAFAAAGRHLSFRAAADDLGVTQGAVAQQVRGLEEHLGLRLFLREPRGLAFTEEGRAYHAPVSRAFSQLSDATAALRSAPSRVTISVTPTFASKWLIPRLAEFTAAHPGIDLRITATERVSSFHSDGIDLAVRQGRPPFGASLRADLMFRQDVIAVCSPSLVAAHTLPLDAAGLARMTLLHDTHDLWPKFIGLTFGDDAEQPRGLRFNQTTLSLDAALAGQGIALASRYLVQRDLETGRLVQPIDGALEAGLDFYLLTPRQGASDASLHVRDWLLGMTSDGG
ncbi:LysR family transcriptional regulator, glycine cleavage system transcriptional activator [Cribrihabitans marinus]|uniref:LysR family transcriptional regulator, glycine cleavage system transcriptional activator n=1 Tax=Cribrihabitans marinus TaxID=1227549 RepID=A0A1H6ZDQ0_9RHOB|nr:LysR substrate-binding domain-containing protein [Cribrihabitans marinus]GGH30991.1 LysR family transcriptional regulator [Cribrihabitans marinus]SEJ50826.1 LysR family transcriptional regulator, glycine cleavage system transcriptional activator [Cribrihabitans marinus]